jgi:hypothetical protein
MARESDRDVREEIRIALFWRALIGDYEYIKFNPDDLLRWYDALALRGPEEIRTVLDERYATRPVPAVLGIVSKAPHPPVWLVREWLMHHEQKVRTGGYWMATGTFIFASFLFFPMMYGCTQLKPVSPYAMNPPESGPTPYTSSGPVGANYYPNPVMTPTTMQPSQPGPTSPTSTGIAGAAMGVTTPGGVTGATNGGLSAGATSAPSSGSTQQP